MYAHSQLFTLANKCVDEFGLVGQRGANYIDIMGMTRTTTWSKGRTRKRYQSHALRELVLLDQAPSKCFLFFHVPIMRVYRVTLHHQASTRSRKTGDISFPRAQAFLVVRSQYGHALKVTGGRIGMETGTGLAAVLLVLR
jgi:hypothetical protein